jgi:transcriptional regulator with XRE-family HTH domain
MKKEFKDRLKQAMDFRNVKAVDLCERGNIPKSAMSYYISGRSEPKHDRLYIIAKLLDVSEAWLLGYDVPMERGTDQRELDELSALNERIKKEPEFRRLVIQINHLNPEQLEAVNNLLSAFPQ